MEWIRLASYFPSPFARPPGRGASSSTVNVLWGAFNIAIGYVLVVRVGAFDPRRTSHILAAGAGAAAIALILARQFGQIHGGNLSDLKSEAARTDQPN